ncbi:MAG: hypothetical protein A2X22_08450 [Bacteroidetes bacterium GWF2_49_14]|nr:MAG: hypothetical protein A2X22_08450 [Bacteroidetes bacterium GWF2_49_14]
MNSDVPGTVSGMQRANNQNKMKLKGILSLAALYAIFISVSGQEKTGKVIWQVGKPDKSCNEFALAPAGYREIKADGFFIVGKSNPSIDWPYAHPGPNDSWAGARQHSYSILFGIKGQQKGDSCKLTLDCTDIHGSAPPQLEIRINSFVHKNKLPTGGGDASINGDATKSKPFGFELTFPAGVFKEGMNEVVITSAEGSWFLYDAVRLFGPADIKATAVKDFLMITRSEAGNALTGTEGNYKREVYLTVVNGGDSFSGDITINTLPVKRVTIGPGRQEFVVQVPEVGREGSVSAGVMKGGKVIASAVVPMKPVKQMMVYILPHSHTDIGYTEIQTAIEDKQVNNLVQGIEYAKKTASYPEGARFVWNVEVAWAADLYLNRLGSQAREDLLEAMRKGQVSMNGMYLNELTGLCRPEELLRLFRYSTELGKITGQKVDAAMISDVPGYTWGTVTAMAQSGIRYFSVAPNFFDRIGDILVRWENKPFYWESPSGQEKVLVWIPLKGYAMSHIIGKLSPVWVSDYTGQLEKMGYPYDIAHIRWSGHGDNAVPDPAICEFVKEWNTKYAWPKFKISSTSEAFSAFEKKYGSQIPTVKGDWTPYWEDGAGSSALETGLNRNTADKLSQAEVLWALQSPGTYPVARFEEAWKKVLLYSEHTWGAWCSITDPENKMTVEQWEIKKSYADDAARLTEALLGEAGDRRRTTDDGRPMEDKGGLEVVNTTSWKRSEMVFLSREQSSAGDVVKDANGKVLSSQRMADGELAVLGLEADPFSSASFTIEKGTVKPAGSVVISKNTISNNLIECEIGANHGDIISLIDKRTGKNLADVSGGQGLNRYLFFEGNDLAGLKTNGSVNIRIKENGPLVGALEITSQAPGCNGLVTEVWLAHNADYLVIINIVDKKRAPMPDKIGDWFLAQNKNKESVNFGFPFAVPGGTMRLDLPLGQMIPWIDQIPSACKNWYTVGRWADVSNDQFGVTWVTLDAPLLQVGELSARLIGSQNNPEAWRKTVEPTQTLYSWAMNNHWGTNYRQYQEGIVTFRYVLKPHDVFDATVANRFATGLSQPLLVRPAGETALTAPFKLISKSVTVIACKPADDGNGVVLTLYNPALKPDSFILSTVNGSKIYRCDSGENILGGLPATVEMAGQAVMSVRF